MCGFLSIYCKKNNLRKKIDIIKNNFVDFKFRGPDNSGFEELLINNCNLIIAHHRLSIIDLDARSNQPMNSNDGRYKIIFNGEIYNHKNIRAELQLKYNIVWKGHSDTETLLNLLSLYPIEHALKRIVGMFAFVFFDFKENKVVICRDRAGEKPLYFAINNDFIGFSSDLRAFKNLVDFKSSINKDAYSKYLEYNYVPHPYSIINNIYKLPPASFLTINLGKVEFEKYRSFQDLIDNKNFQFKKYWKIEDRLEKNKKYFNNDNPINKVDFLIEKSVKSQLLSDVPVGAFLSGGNDSALIVANMQKFQKTNTFTIGFTESEHDESKIALQISKILKTNHTTINCSNYDARNLIPDINLAFSEPFADSSQIPTMLVSKFASKNVKVALSGDGGDEIFGGYNRYLIASKYWQVFNLLKFKNKNILVSILNSMPTFVFNFLFRNNLQNYTKLNNNSTISIIQNKLKNITDEKSFYESLVNQYFGFIRFKDSNFNYVKYTDDIIKNMMLSDFNTYLTDDILCKVDRSSMFYSLELRSPYLDKDLIDYSINIPTKLNIKNGKSKLILKKILENYLPAHIIYNKKKGFSVPISEWIKKDLRDWAEEYLSKESINLHGLIDYNLASSLKNEHFKNQKNNEHKLWSIIQFNSWYSTL